VRWIRLDINRVVATGDGNFVEHPDLSRVDEVGSPIWYRGAITAQLADRMSPQLESLPELPPTKQPYWQSAAALAIS
jgi:hypothetical protein